MGIGAKWFVAALHYGSALHLLEKGGLDLSLKKWIELVSLRMEE